MVWLEFEFIVVHWAEEPEVAFGFDSAGADGTASERSRKSRSPAATDLRPRESAMGLLACAVSGPL